MSPKTDKPEKEAPLPNRTKSFSLQGSTAAKIEALAAATSQSESSIVNEILEKGSAQMILERAPDLATQWPPLRYHMGRIEGALRIQRPGGIEAEGNRAYSFEMIQDISDINDRQAVLVTLAYIYDAGRKLWRRLTDEEARDLIADVHGPNQISMVTAVGVRWALIEARDLVNRDFVPPLRDVLVRLRRVPAEVCPYCQSPLLDRFSPRLVSKPPRGVTFVCTSAQCNRYYAMDRTGNLVLVPGSPDRRAATGPLTFAQLRGILPPAAAVTDEELGQARGARREIR